ncbi:hypothetical protein [Cellvibrio japonicus]|uniref:hypothetical protein n=1 Tax=Cellvibrio japonicus TaxID=155077 RepID=UPI0005A04E71|nr:hypothetical protein [Cellvibrio japonicus]QEI13664.1 hypothetical protein FY117_16565 [Cellvibrio japonicus]QEI17237.1 hypothetical protein FY116_16565 [Cellvibrio japonicus]QEI20815.1 hypothetical protein FY115_16565 [Cellvibrio japonicus]
MEFRRYFVTVLISGILVLSGAFYLYSNLLYPLKTNISDIVDRWIEIKINEEALAKKNVEIRDNLTSDLSETLILQINIAVLTKENERLKESLEKAMLTLSERERSSDKIAILSVLIAFLAMLPSWLELFLKFRRKSQN